MPRLDLLVIQEIPPKDRGGWRESVGPEAYNAIQLFMHFFPKTVLDGAGKVTIYVGKKPDDKPIYYYSDYFKVSMYYAGEETENKRRQLKAEEWDDFYTDLIEKTLIDIAKRAGNEEVIPEIKRAISSVRSTGYKLLVPIKKLSKRSPNRMYQAVTYKYLTPQGELDFIEITDKLKEKNTYVISDGYVKFPLEWYASKCEWAENRFVIKDRLDGIRAYVDADTKSMYSLHNKNKTADRICIDEKDGVK